MLQAYAEGKDLYCVIAQSMFNNEYEDNLEFYKEFTKIELDGQTVTAGTGEEKEVTVDNSNSIEIPWCYIVSTERGELTAENLTIGDSVVSDLGNLKICAIAEVNANPVKMLRLTFEELT